MPCGTPPFIFFKSDTQEPTLTLCSLPVRKSLIQFIIVGGMSIEENLSSRTSWSIWSKPFAKSSSKILMTFLEPSFSLRIWWTRLSSAWVVEEPFNEPNWRVSSLVIMDLTSQSATNRSQIFARVGVSEIGRKSVLISVSTFVFWIEMTSAFFHLAGMEACWIDALKIEAIGKAGIDE